MSYPSEIVLVRGSEELKFLERVSEVLEDYSLLTNGNEVVLDKDLFGKNGTQQEFEIFVDLFFPEMGIQPLFVFKNDKLSINPKREITEKEVYQVIDYLLQDPNKYLEFLNQQARKSINLPSATVPRGKGHPSKSVKGINNGKFEINFGEYRHSEFENRENEEFPVNNESFNFLNDEEENLYGKLSSKNFSKYAPKSRKGGKRATKKRSNKKRGKTRQRKR